uniref:SCO-spondin-like n=1 Tax=Saccoglossus kowalevskii TaxID=10224 RepID=A0ABM0MLM5_SACKO|nr:PREDICTED: SCO-spondin-like [Saccoglossus kowalevskii]
MWEKEDPENFVYQNVFQEGAIKERCIDYITITWLVEGDPLSSPGYVIFISPPTVEGNFTFIIEQEDLSTLFDPASGFLEYTLSTVEQGVTYEIAVVLLDGIGGALDSILLVSDDICVQELDPCLNGGTCCDDGEEYICYCTEGYEGNECQNDVDPCDPDPCLNGGICIEQETGYLCSCPEGSEGNHCEELVLVEIDYLTIDTYPTCTTVLITWEAQDAGLTPERYEVWGYPLGPPSPELLCGCEHPTTQCLAEGLERSSTYLFVVKSIAGDEEVDSVETTFRTTDYFPIGITTVEYTIVENAVLTDKCKFNVTVKERGLCIAYGDPHYIMFSGASYDYQGACTYLLVGISSSASPNFNVTALNVPFEENTDVTVIKEVNMTTIHTEISLKEGGEVRVDGITVRLPMTPEPGLHIMRSGTSVVITTDNGVYISYDGYHYAVIKIPADPYKFKSNGLCGLFGGDGYIKPGGEEADDINDFGDSWATHEVCDPTSTTIPECPTGYGTDTCEIIIDPDGHFGDCHDVIDPTMYYDSCLYDYCATNEYCPVIEAYSNDCSDKGVEVGDWRDEEFCPLECGNNMIHRKCGNPCVDTCVEPEASDHCLMTDCVEGCFCPNGTVLNDDKCTDPLQCGCRANGRYYQIGDTIVVPGCTDVCECTEDHSLVCTPMTCDENASCVIVDGIRGCTCDAPNYEGNGLNCSEKCADPGSPTNGGQNEDHEYPVSDGTEVSFYCDTGYALYDTDTETCLDEVVSMCIDGEWTEPVPTCQPTCEDPGQPENGKQDDEYEYPVCEGTVIGYVCDDLYEVIGSPSSTCEDGQWTTPPPECRAGGCDDPGSPDNGHQVDEYTYPVPSGTIVRFCCDDGYVVNGEQAIICGKDGTWFGELPTCEPTCSDPGAPENGYQVEEYDYPVLTNTTVTFECNDGYERHGKGYTQCQDTIWEPPVDDTYCTELEECCSDPCQNGGTCIDGTDRYDCLCPRGFDGHNCEQEYSVCYVWGDPHYITYDGVKYDFQGDCIYILSESATYEMTSFRVLANNEAFQARDETLSVTQELIVIVYGQEVRLMRGRNVKVNGEQVTLPYTVSPEIEVRVTGSYISVFVDFGLVVRWDGYHHGDVKAPGMYKGGLRGLCGNFNDYPEDDFTDTEGRLIPSEMEHSHRAAMFGNTWVANEEECDSHAGGCNPCAEDIDVATEAHELCSVFTDKNGPFAVCHDAIDPEDFFSSCMFDLCAKLPDLGGLCMNAEVYAQVCLDIGIQLIGDVMTYVFGETITLEKCDEDCTCREDGVVDCVAIRCDPSAYCGEKDGVHGCHCNDGYQGNGKRCIDTDECLSDPCHNGGTCIDEVDGYQCECSDGWEGDNCDSDIDECQSNPCHNGGTCIDGVNGYHCECADGWEGDNCDSDKDECLSDPCHNGGTCVDDMNGYTCQCPNGFGGDQCDLDTDECQSYPCHNGGTCIDEVNGYRCDCADGWEGENCDYVSDKDECQSDPCHNGGTCIDEVNGYQCNCADGWEGDNCDSDIDECQSNPCHNGGTCIDEVNGYHCDCADGWEGDNCDSEIDECQSDPCHNGGTCIDEMDGYHCDCADGYEGDNCDSDTDECQSDPCHNGGTCIDEVNGYQCECADGWEGENCDYVSDTDECQSDPCHNGGTCIDEVNGYQCNCADGWEGNNCDSDIDECQSDPCHNGGTCIDEVNGYHCDCEDGWEGDDCDSGYYCSSNPCPNGASCRDITLGYECICLSGYTGSNCETDIDECQSDPCHNGGACIDEVNGYHCDCADGWEGDHCDSDIDECQSDPCHNGGTCIDEMDGYHCDCADGYEGDNCNSDIDECQSNPCHNGGTCIDEVNGYHCDCADGWEGDNCDSDIDECASDPCHNGGTCVDGVDGYICQCDGAWGGVHCDLAHPCKSNGTIYPNGTTVQYGNSCDDCVCFNGMVECTYYWGEPTMCTSDSDCPIGLTCQAQESECLQDTICDDVLICKGEEAAQQSVEDGAPCAGHYSGTISECGVMDIQYDLSEIWSTTVTALCGDLMKYLEQTIENFPNCTRMNCFNYEDIQETQRRKRSDVLDTRTQLEIKMSDDDGDTTMATLALMNKVEETLLTGKKEGTLPGGLSAMEQVVVIVDGGEELKTPVKDDNEALWNILLVVAILLLLILVLVILVILVRQRNSGTGKTKSNESNHNVLDDLTVSETWSSNRPRSPERDYYTRTMEAAQGRGDIPVSEYSHHESLSGWPYDPNTNDDTPRGSLSRPVVMAGEEYMEQPSQRLLRMWIPKAEDNIYSPSPTVDSQPRSEDDEEELPIF